MTSSQAQARVAFDAEPRDSSVLEHQLTVSQQILDRLRSCLLQVSGTNVRRRDCRLGARRSASAYTR
jgi:hypothetical protein